MGDKVLTAREVAGLLRISAWMVYELTRQGVLPHFCVGRCRRYFEADVLAWAAESTKRIE